MGVSVGGCFKQIMVFRRERKREKERESGGWTRNREV